MATTTLRKYSIEIKPVLKGLRQVQGGIKTLRRGLNDITSTGNGVANTFKRLIAGYLSFQAATRAGTFLISTISEFETLRTQLQTVLQVSEQVADVKFKELQEFAKVTPFQLQNVTKAFLTLSARGIQVTQEDLRNVGNVAAAWGQDITSFAHAVGQATSGELERLKAFGIGAKTVGDQIQFTIQDAAGKPVQTKVKKDVKEIGKFLIGLGKTRFAGGIERQAKTLAGLYSTLKDNLGQFVNAIGASGLLDEIKDIVKSANDWFSANEAVAKGIGKRLTQAVNKLVDVLKQAHSLILRLKDAMARWSGAIGGVSKNLNRLLALISIAALQKLGTTLLTIGEAVLSAFAGIGVTTFSEVLIIIAGIAAQLLVVYLVIEDIITYFRGGDSVLGRALYKAQTATDGFWGALGKLITQAKALFKELEPTFAFWAEMFRVTLPGAIEKFKAVAAAVFMTLGIFVKLLVRAFALVIDVIRITIKLLQGDFSGAFDILKQAASDFFGGLLEDIFAAIDAFSDLFAIWDRASTEQTKAIKATTDKFFPGEGATPVLPATPGAALADRAGGDVAARATNGGAPVVPPANIQQHVEVHATTNADPAEIADATAKRVGEETERANRQHMAQVQAGER